MQDLNDMYLFAKVVEHGGYSAAARALGLQTSKLSRRINELEASLGVRLLNRTTRRVSVTEVGQAFYRHCVALVAEAQAAREAIERTRSVPQGLVRMSCPPGLLQDYVAPVVARYLTDHPQVRLRVEATNRRVDVVEEHIDLALRVRTPPLEDSELAVRTLAMTGARLVASPWFFATHPRPVHPNDLSDMPTLAMFTATERPVWPFRCPDHGILNVAHVPRLALDDFPTLRVAALQGVGIAFLPSFMVEADLKSGALEHVLPEYALPEAVIHVVFPSRRGLVPAVRMLVDALVAGFAQGGAPSANDGDIR